MMRREWRAFGNVGSTWPTAGTMPKRPTPDRRKRMVEGGFSHLDGAAGAGIDARGSGKREREVGAAPDPIAGEDSYHYVDVAPFADLPDGEATTVRVAGREVALCRQGEEVFAVTGACSYHPLPLRGGKVEGDVLTCEWYGAQFDLRTGESVFLRSVRPLDTYPTTVRDGRVFLQVPR